MARGFSGDGVDEGALMARGDNDSLRPKVEKHPGSTDKPLEELLEAQQGSRSAARGKGLTRTQVALLRYVAGETATNGGAHCSKRELADILGRSVKTIDRLVSDLRERGFLVVEEHFDARGAQLANTYRIVVRPNQTK